MPGRIVSEHLIGEPVEGKGGLLGSNPPRNSRLETHCDGPGADRNGSALVTRRLPSHHLFEHRSRSPNPSKTHPRHGAMVAGLGAIGRRCGSTMVLRTPPWR